MHKYFAKTLFIGKKAEYLPECHGTNQFLAHQPGFQTLPEGYLVYTDYQLHGKGQRGSTWTSEPGKNLLFSVLLRPETLLSKEAYLVNITVALALADCLNSRFEKPFEIKWPNDIYVDGQKIAGILVETTIKSKNVATAVVGIGLNVNQRAFLLPTATSLFLKTGREIDREGLLEDFLIVLEKHYTLLRNGSVPKLLSDYYQVMRWRGEPHTFEDSGGAFEGEILGVGESGRLLVRANRQIRRFDIKEIRFLY